MPVRTPSYEPLTEEFHNIKIALPNGTKLLRKFEINTNFQNIRDYINRSVIDVFKIPI